MSLKPIDENSPVHLGEVFAQSRQNAEQLSALGSKLDTIVAELRKAIEQTQERAERLVDSVRRSTAPNMGNIWMGIAVAISFVALIGSVFAYGISRELNRLDLSFDKLDAKLQREQALGSEVSHREVQAAKEQLDEVKARLLLCESRQWDAVKSDLDELRQRRLKDVQKNGP